MKTSLVALVMGVCCLLAGCATGPPQAFRPADIAQIRDIQTRGVGNRFVIPVEVAVPSGWKTTLEFIPVLIGVWIRRPDGLLYMVPRNKMRAGNIEPVKIGDGCVLLFKRSDILFHEIPFREWVFSSLMDFSSSMESPLAFLVVRGKGMVYLSGTGFVQSPDGKKVSLPITRRTSLQDSQKVSPIQSEANKVHLHIICVKSQSDANDVVRRLENGESFSKLAKDKVYSS